MIQKFFQANQKLKLKSKSKVLKICLSLLVFQGKWETLLFGNPLAGLIIRFWKFYI